LVHCIFHKQLLEYKRRRKARREKGNNRKSFLYDKVLIQSIAYSDVELKKIFSARGS